MRNKLLLFAITIFYLQKTEAQNVGIGVAEPINKLHLAGNLLVHAPSASTTTLPTPAQHFTLVNGNSVTINDSDSTWRIYDPGGPSGDYNANLTANALILSLPTSLGIELTIESINLGAGDSLTIRATNSPASTVYLAVGNGYNSTGKLVFSTSSFYLRFKSNNDASTGSGFSLLFKRLFEDSAGHSTNMGILTKSFFFDTKTGALRAGKNNNAGMGNFSVALGIHNTASGENSVAFGIDNTASGENSVALGMGTIARGQGSIAMGNGALASGYYSVAIGNNTEAQGIYAFAGGMNTSTRNDASFAMGFNTKAWGNVSTAFGSGSYASGNLSTAFGYYTTASGITSTAMGYYSNANGDYSTAMGNQTTAGYNSTAMGYLTTAGSNATAMGSHTTASGHRSTAIGNYVSTNNEEGALVIGDYSTTTVMNSATPNSFRARFDGGYRFYTSSDLTTNALLSNGSNAWSTSSDVRLKENFAEVDGEDFLKKIAAMKLVSWNYKKQDAAKFRHYGPMAQDFYTAFGKDKHGSIGNDTTINQADFDGVNMIAIQALEKRTAQQQAQLEVSNNELKKELDELKAVLTQLQKELKIIKNKN